MCWRFTQIWAPLMRGDQLIHVIDTASPYGAQSGAELRDA